MNNISTNRTVAFFDLDHTIIDENSGIVLCFRLLREVTIPRFTLPKLFFFFIGFLTGFISEHEMFHITTLMMKGIDMEHFEQMTKHVAEHSLLKKIRPEIREALARHQKLGHRTVIISSSITPMCEPIRKHLGIDGLLCSDLAAADGKLTGEPQGKLCYGKEKLVQAQRYCAENGFDMESSWYYADSSADIYLLEKVAHPVCVFPTKKLKAQAEKRGWEIWRK